MNTTVSRPAPRIVEEQGRWFGALPGIILLAVIGYAGKVTEQSITAYGIAHGIAPASIPANSG